MRIKVVLAALALALAILWPAVIYQRTLMAGRHGQPPARVRTGEETSERIAAQASGPSSGVRFISGGDLARSVDERVDPSSPDHLSYVAQREEELGELATTRDPAALSTILSELNDPEAGIRRAALLATIDFGSPTAVPALQNEVWWTEDSQEKAALENAIDFLQLPPARPNGVDSSGR